MIPSYDRWRLRLAGEKVVLHELPEPEDCGFYRLPIREQQPLKNGQGTRWNIVGWRPVALMVHADKVVAVIDNCLVDGNELDDQWLWFAPHPISEDEYRSVAEKGEGWSDESFKGETK